jgi:hypothetical protein
MSRDCVSYCLLLRREPMLMLWWMEKHSPQSSPPSLDYPSIPHTRPPNTPGQHALSSPHLHSPTVLPSSQYTAPSSRRSRGRG